MKLLRPDGRRSINLQPGDILRVKAGTTAYMINRDSSQRIVMVKLVLPVFNPGHFEVNCCRAIMWAIIFDLVLLPYLSFNFVVN